MAPDTLVFAAALLGKTALFTVYCYLVGEAALQLIRRACGSPAQAAPNVALRLFFSISMGMCLVTMVLFALGLASVLTTVATSVALATCLLGALAYIRSQQNAPLQVFNSARALNAVQVAEVTFMTALFIWGVLAAIKPPGMWDDTSYHLPYARHYLEHQAILINPYLRFPLFPHNANLLFVLGLMVGTETDAQVLASLPLFVIALGLFGASKVFIQSTSAGFVATLVFFSLGPTLETLGYAYIDNLLAAYSWGAILAMALWLRNPHGSMQWLVVSAALAGTAAGTKLFGGVVAFFIGLYLLVSLRGWRSVLTFAVVTSLFGLGWYARSFYISGDPVHPAGGHFFGHYLWNEADLALQQSEQTTRGVVKTPLHFFNALQTAGLSLFLPAFFVLGQPARRKGSEQFLYLVFVTYMVFWFFVAQIGRYAAPVLALGAFLSTLFAYRAGFQARLRQLFVRPWFKWMRRAALVGVGIYSVSMVSTGFSDASSRVANWDSSLRATAGYEVMTAANNLAPKYGDLLLQVGYENASYFFNGTTVGDWFGPGRYANMLRCASGQCTFESAARLSSVMHKFGARMLAVNSKRFAFDIQQYQELFQVEYQASDGYLLSLKE